MCDSSVPDAQVTTFDGHFANSLDDGEEIRQWRRSQVLEQFEFREENVVGQCQVMNTKRMRSFLTLAVCNIEIHIFVSDTMNRSVDRMIWLFLRSTWFSKGLTLTEMILNILDLEDTRTVMTHFELLTTILYQYSMSQHNWFMCFITKTGTLKLGFSSSRS